MTEAGARAARALELELAEMAARGVPELHAERFKIEALTKPKLGFTTQRDVDAASPSTQKEWREAASKFRVLDLEAGGGRAARTGSSARDVVYDNIFVGSSAMGVRRVSLVARISSLHDMSVGTRARH